MTTDAKPDISIMDTAADTMTSAVDFVKDKVDDVTKIIGQEDAPAKQQTLIKNKRRQGIYLKSLLKRSLVLSFQEVGSNIKQIMEEKLIDSVEGRCVEEGFVKRGSIKIIQYSSGNIEGNKVKFSIMAECLICYPVEGMVFKAVVKDVTLAGIRAETREEYSPVDIFVARDHHFDNKRFNSVKEGDIIKIRVIGQRFEVNDERISVIAELMFVEKK